MGWCKGKSEGKGKNSEAEGRKGWKGWKGWCKGLTGGKGKGKCNGFWGKDWCGEDPHAATIAEATEETQTLRPCATVGCPFQATWHAMLCCGACKGDGCRHGPRCERKPMPAK